MGQAAVRPAYASPRRVLAWALAVLANAVILALILLAPRTPVVPPPLHVINLELVADVLPAVEPEPESEPVPTPADPVPVPLPDRDEAQDADTGNDPVVEQQLNTRPAADEAVVDDRTEAGSATGLADYEIIALPETAARTGTPFVIREIFCLTSSEATREAGHCSDEPNPDRLSMLRFASDANLETGLQAAVGYGMSPEQIRALFEGDGLPLADLSGEPTLADASQRPTSSADQMRDSLPPRHPDPAFRD